MLTRTKTRGAREPGVGHSFRARIYPALGLPLDILIHSISRRGIGGTVEGIGFVRGERVFIELPYLGKIACIIRWAKGRKVGIQTGQDLDVNAFRFELHALPL